MREYDGVILMCICHCNGSESGGHFDACLLHSYHCVRDGMAGEGQSSENKTIKTDFTAIIFSEHNKTHFTEDSSVLLSLAGWHSWAFVHTPHISGSHKLKLFSM